MVRPQRPRSGAVFRWIEVKKQGAEIVSLKLRLALTSHNSSKPPSSDGYAKPAPKSRRVRTGKKPGKQPGDPGKHLAQRIGPDATMVHEPGQCRSCGCDLSVAEVCGTTARQVFDLPPAALFCTEHQVRSRRCACGTVTNGSFPTEASAPACYGPALRAYVCYLVTRQHLPVARVAELLVETYGASVSTGTIVAMVHEGAGMLEGFLAKVKTLLHHTRVVHADETGLRANARLHWVHVTSSTELTLYHLDERRGVNAINDMGVVAHLPGILVHDGFKPYGKYLNVAHALCNAHHLRELEAVAAIDGQHWASDMAGLLAGTWRQVLSAKADGRWCLGEDELDDVHARYRAIIKAGHKANPPPPRQKGRPKRSVALNLLDRLDINTEDILRFASDFSVPFDNNLAERDVRMVKIAQKISGGFRSTDGARDFLALRSYLSTAGKQGVNRLEALQRLFKGDPWMPAVPALGL
jgi:transposase